MQSSKSNNSSSDDHQLSSGFELGTPGSVQATVPVDQHGLYDQNGFYNNKRLGRERRGVNRNRWDSLYTIARYR
jgi:hypothetical protein